MTGLGSYWEAAIVTEVMRTVVGACISYAVRRV